MARPQKLATCLWFDRDAEAAMRFYISLFPGSRVLAESRWAEGGPMPKGLLLTARVLLAGTEFLVLNGGPMFHLTEAVSMVVSCETQQEIDELWQQLTADGGQPSMCGWLKDRFGLSWQLVPRQLEAMMQDPDPARVKRVMEALLQMRKLDIAKLEQAFAGK